jgi:hypothetical protein
MGGKLRQTVTRLEKGYPMVYEVVLKERLMQSRTVSY